MAKLPELVGKHWIHCGHKSKAGWHPPMAISENNRKRFEGVGLEKIRRELTVGDYHYIPVDDTTQAEAREWAAEQEAKLEKEKEDARELEAHRFRSVLGWTVAGVIVTVVAAAAIIAAGSIIKEIR